MSNPIQIQNIPIKTIWNIDEMFRQYYIELLKLKAHYNYQTNYYWLKSRYSEFLNYPATSLEDWESKHSRDVQYENMVEKYEYFFLKDRSPIDKILLPKYEVDRMKFIRTGQTSLFI